MGADDWKVTDDGTASSGNVTVNAGETVTVLGVPRSPSQIALELLRMCEDGAIDQLIVIAKDPEGYLSVAWDESVDTPDLCEFQTFLRLEAERCVVDDQMGSPYVDSDSSGDPDDDTG